jgi:hypothetical protein
VLLDAVQETCDGFGAACSLHLTLCPAGGQKWLTAANALQHTWKQQVDQLVQGFLEKRNSAQPQQQQQQQRVGLPAQPQQQQQQRVGLPAQLRTFSAGSTAPTRPFVSPSQKQSQKL